MATVNLSYAVSASITLTAPAAGAAREGNVIDNGTNKYEDALVSVRFTSGTIGGNKQLVVYCYGSEDGTNYESVVTGLDAAITLRSPESLQVAAVVPTPTSTVSYKKTFTIAQFFGGVLPRKWGLVLNDDGAGTTGGITALSISYTGVTHTVV